MRVASCWGRGKRGRRGNRLDRDWWFGRLPTSAPRGRPRGPKEGYYCKNSTHADRTTPQRYSFSSFPSTVHRRVSPPHLNPLIASRSCLLRWGSLGAKKGPPLAVCIAEAGLFSCGGVCGLLSGPTLLRPTLLGCRGKALSVDATQTLLRQSSGL